MKEIYINVKPFIFKQSVYVLDKELHVFTEPQKVSLGDIPAFIESLQHEVDTVHIIGNVNFARKLQKEYLTKFSSRSIKFVVNE